MKPLKTLILIACFAVGAVAMPIGSPLSGYVTWQFSTRAPDQFRVHVADHNGTSSVYAVPGIDRAATIYGFYSGHTYTITVSAVKHGVEFGASKPVTVTAPYLSPSALGK